MANRSPRRLKTGQRNLRGKKSMAVCPCCDQVIDHRDKIFSVLDDLAMRQEPLDAEFESAIFEDVEKLYES